MSETTGPTTTIPPAYAKAVKAQQEKANAVKAMRLTIQDGPTVRYVCTGPSYGSVEQEIAKIRGSVPVGQRAIFRSPTPNGPGQGWIAAGYLA